MKGNAQCWHYLLMVETWCNRIKYMDTEPGSCQDIRFIIALFPWNWNVFSLCEEILSSAHLFDTFKSLPVPRKRFFKTFQKIWSERFLKILKTCTKSNLSVFRRVTYYCVVWSLWLDHEQMTVWNLSRLRIVNRVIRRGHLERRARVFRSMYSFSEFIIWPIACSDQGDIVD